MSEGKREEKAREKERDGLRWKKGERRTKGKMRGREGGRVKKREREILKEGEGGRERDFLERGAMFVTFYRTGRNCIRLNVA